MTKNSSSQFYAGREPTRERVGVVVDGTNAAVAIKTIIADRSCWSTPNMDGSTT